MAGPLDGIRVLDLTIAQQGPTATLLLSEMGADVVKVEPPGKGELGRGNAIDRETGVSAYFLALNRGKRGIAVDMKKPDGREIILRLATECDVVAHNFRPGVMEKLGLTYEVLRDQNPRIIYAYATAFGDNGPLGHRAGNDILAQAMSGLMSMTGEGSPLPAGAALADHIGALNLALGIVSAIVAREKTGRGQIVETSLLGAMLNAQSWELAHHMLTGDVPAQARRGHPHLFFQWWTFESSDGWFVIGGIGRNDFGEFCRAIGLPELVEDERFDSVGKRIRARDELNEILNDHFRIGKRDDWLARLQAVDVLCAPVLNYVEVVSHPQVTENHYTTTIVRDDVGETRVIATPIHFSDTPAGRSDPDPRLGEDTDEVLAELGYAPEEVARLHKDGAI